MFFEIQEANIYNCCPSWVNHNKIGDTNSDLNIDDVWNGALSQEFRKSILDGSFRLCNRELCPLIKNGSLPLREDVLAGEIGEYYSTILNYNLVHADKPHTINLCYDRSCNLRCPSCRSNFIYYNEKLHKKKFDRLTAINEAILAYVHSSTKPIELNITGSGDPFGSKNFFNLLKSLNCQRNPKLRLTLQTNGVLFDRQRWSQLENLHAFRNISTIISLDAGTKEAYDKTRVGGDWEKVNENLVFIKELLDQGYLNYVRLDMVVQNNNYKTIPEFVDIARKFGFHSYTSRIINWGTFSDVVFKTHNIFDEGHENHSDLKQVIAGVEYDLHDWGNISELKQ